CISHQYSSSFVLHCSINLRRAHKSTLFPYTTLFRSWEKDFNKVKELSDEIIKFKGKVVENSNSLYEVLTKRDKILRLINNVFAYTHMRLDEDSRNSTYQALNDRDMNLSVLVSEETCFIVSESIIY